MTSEEELPKPGDTTNRFDGKNDGTVYQMGDVNDVIHVDNINIVHPLPVPVPEPASPARQLLPFVPHLVLAILFGSLGSILVVYHQSLLFRLLVVLAVLAPFILLGVLLRHTRLIGWCTPKVLSDARPPALIALAALTLLLAAGVLIWPPRLWDGYPQRDAIVLALLFTDIAALSISQVARRSRQR